MTKIIIGKQGDQKFPIKNAGVSRQHASITIEGGRWILEDLDSTNGTFVRDDNGLYQRVSRVEIKEDTMVRLGDESSNGYAFMAHHVVEDDPENYAYEFARLAEWRDRFKKERERCQAAQRNRRLVQILISVVVIAVSYMPFLSEQPRLQLMVMRIGMLLPPVYIFFASGKNKMQLFSASKAKEIVCFFDACFSGTIAQDVRSSDKDIVFFLSSRPDEMSQEDSGWIGAGYLTQALLKGIRGMADTDHNKEVTVMELFKYIYKDVTARVEKRNSNAPDDRYKVRQHPQLVAAKRSYNMVLTKW